MSSLQPPADIPGGKRNVRFVPIADIAGGPVSWSSRVQITSIVYKPDPSTERILRRKVAPDTRQAAISAIALIWGFACISPSTVRDASFRTRRQIAQSPLS